MELQSGQLLARSQRALQQTEAGHHGDALPPHDLVRGEQHRSPVLRTARREERYVRAALVVIFLVTFLVEMLSYSRVTGHGLRPRRLLLLVGLVQTLVHAVQVGIAHLLMLALMSLNVGVVLVVVAGSAAGFLLFRSSVLLRAGAPEAGRASDTPSAPTK